MRDSTTSMPLPARQTGWSVAVDRERMPWHLSRITHHASLLLFLALAACGGDGEVSTAGAFDDDGVSTAGTFDDAAESSGGSVVDDLAGGMYPGLADAALLDRLDADFSPARTLGYDRARDVLYAREQATDGAVCGLYSDFCIRLPSGDPSTEAFRLGINAEHVWPQSMGARQEPLRSDLHHLFPEREQVNSSRGNLPFGEVPDARADAWYLRDQSQSRPPVSGADAWAERGQGRFEPPESRKGDVARAVFYVVATYPGAIEPAFFATMRESLLAWNRADPPDADERSRSRWVASLQGTENPFVLEPGLADRVWGRGPVSQAPPPVVAPPPAPTPSASALRLSEIHYDNAGEDADEGVEVAGPAGASLDGWRLVLVNGNGGRVYDEVSLRGALPPTGAAWTPTPGLQNGSPDGVALVGPSGVAEFLSYEGAFEAADGPAAGMRSADIGAEQPSDTPPGTTLHRRDGRWAPGPASPGR